MGAEKEPEAGKTTEPTTPAPTEKPAAPSVDWEAQFKASERDRKKIEKEHAALGERINSPAFASELINKALGVAKDADPKAEIESAKQRATKSETVARNALIHASAMQAAIAAGVRPERVTHALKQADFSEAEVDLDKGAVVNGADVFNAAFASLKKDVPEFFAAPASEKPAEKAPLPGEKRTPPTGQPPHTPAPSKRMSYAEFQKLNHADRKKQLAIEKTLPH